MISERTFFLINAKSRVDLLDKTKILVFGSIDYFKGKVHDLYTGLIEDKDGVLTIRFGDSILRFYYGTEEVIEKFVVVDVLFCDDPFKVVSKICIENNWLVFDLESEKYLDF